MDDPLRNPLPPFTRLNVAHYMTGACRDKKETLGRQQDQTFTGDVTCSCGFTLPVRLSYRCLYCGEWYCSSCAETHFRKTVSAHVEDERVKLRERLEAERRSEDS